MADTRRIQTLEAGRGLAALCVVLFHTELTLKSAKYIGHQIYEPFNAMHFGVSFFFVLSGFIITHIHRKDLGDVSSLTRFVSRRFYTIFPPLWAALVLVIAMLVIAKGPAVLDPLSLLSAFSVFPISQEELLLSAEWTLRHEVLFYTIFAIAIFSPRIGLALFIAWVVAPYIFGGHVGGSRWRILLSHYNLLFGFGIVAAIIYNSGRLPAFAAFAIMVLGLATFGATWYADIAYALTPDDPWLVNGYGLGSFLLILAAAEIERRGMVNVPGFLVFLGRTSYSVYLINFPIVAAVARVAAPATLKFGVHPVVSFWMTAGVALVVGILFHLVVVERVITVLLRRRATA